MGPAAPGGAADMEEAGLCRRGEGRSEEPPLALRIRPEATRPGGAAEPPPPRQRPREQRPGRGEAALSLVGVPLGAASFISSGSASSGARCRRGARPSPGRGASRVRWRWLSGPGLGPASGQGSPSGTGRPAEQVEGVWEGPLLPATTSGAGCAARGGQAEPGAQGGSPQPRTVCPARPSSDPPRQPRKRQPGTKAPPPRTLCTFFSLGGRLSRIIFMALRGGSLK